jgi:hypothetical protein
MFLFKFLYNVFTLLQLMIAIEIKGQQIIFTERISGKGCYFIQDACFCTFLHSYTLLS